MKNSFSNLVLFLSFMGVSCSNIRPLATDTAQKQGQSSVTKPLLGQRPLWLTSPAEVCLPTELCAVGEGSRFSNAEASARQELAKIFETEIKSKTVINSRSQTTEQAEGSWEGDHTEEIAQSIEEKTSLILNGVIIRERYQDQTTVYALATLNRNSAANLLKQEIKLIDEQAVAYYNDGKRFALFKAFKLFKEREELAKRYEFLVGNPYPSKLSYTEITNKLKKKVALETPVLVEFKGINGKEETKYVIIKSLLDQGYRVVTNSADAYEYKLIGNLTFTKEHMNVAGFERYTFIIKVTSLTTNGQKLGGLKYSISQSGRSLSQAYEQGLSSINDYIINHLGELQID